MIWTRSPYPAGLLLEGRLIRRVVWPWLPRSCGAVTRCRKCPWT